MRAQTALAEALRLVPSTHWELPTIPAPGDLMASSGLLDHLCSYTHTHSQIYTYTKFKVKINLKTTKQGEIEITRDRPGRALNDTKTNHCSCLSDSLSPFYSLLPLHSPKKQSTGPVFNWQPLSVQLVPRHWKTLIKPSQTSQRSQCPGANSEPSASPEAQPVVFLGYPDCWSCSAVKCQSPECQPHTCGCGSTSCFILSFRFLIKA